MSLYSICEYDSDADHWLWLYVVNINIILMLDSGTIPQKNSPLPTPDHSLPVFSPGQYLPPRWKSPGKPSGLINHSAIFPSHCYNCRLQAIPGKKLSLERPSTFLTIFKTVFMSFLVGYASCSPNCSSSLALHRLCSHLRTVVNLQKLGWCPA